MNNKLLALNLALVVLIAVTGWQLYSAVNEADARQAAVVGRPLEPVEPPPPNPVEPPKPVRAADYYDVARYLLFYLVCGWVATMSHALLSPDSPIPTVGASGAISGVLGAYLVMFPRARVITLIPLGFFIRLTELPALIVLGLWFGLQLLGGMAALGTEGGGVAWWAHVGGFVPGVVIGWLYRMRHPARKQPLDGLGMQYRVVVRRQEVRGVGVL